MEDRLISMAVSLLDPRRARQRAAQGTFGLLALAAVWYRSVQKAPEAAARRVAARERINAEVDRRLGER